MGLGRERPHLGRRIQRGCRGPEPASFQAPANIWHWSLSPGLHLYRCIDSSGSCLSISVCLRFPGCALGPGACTPLACGMKWPRGPSHGVWESQTGYSIPHLPDSLVCPGHSGFNTCEACRSGQMRVVVPPLSGGSSAAPLSRSAPVDGKAGTWLVGAALTPCSSVGSGATFKGGSPRRRSPSTFSVSTRGLNSFIEIKFLHTVHPIRLHFSGFQRVYSCVHPYLVPEYSVLPNKSPVGSHPSAPQPSAPTSPHSVCGSACCGHVAEMGSHAVWSVWHLTEHRVFRAHPRMARDRALLSV